MDEVSCKCCREAIKACSSPSDQTINKQQCGYQQSLRYDGLSSWCLLEAAETKPLTGQPWSVVFVVTAVESSG